MAARQGLREIPKNMPCGFDELFPGRGSLGRHLRR